MVLESLTNGSCMNSMLYNLLTLELNFETNTRLHLYLHLRQEQYLKGENSTSGQLPIA